MPLSSPIGGGGPAKLVEGPCAAGLHPVAGEVLASDPAGLSPARLAPPPPVGGTPPPEGEEREKYERSWRSIPGVSGIEPSDFNRLSLLRAAGSSALKPPPYSELSPSRGRALGSGPKRRWG